MHHHRIIVVDNDMADHELMHVAFEKINAAKEVLFLKLPMMHAPEIFVPAH